MNNEHVHPIFQPLLKQFGNAPAAASKIEVMYRKYVGSGPVDFARLYDCVRNECRAAEKGETKVSRDLLRELRADRAFVGEVMNSECA